MAFTWRFFTGGQTVEPVSRKCHRGPMIDVEYVMSRPFQYMLPYETLRARLLENIVDSTLPAVRTREVVLRTINTMLGPMFARLAPQRKSLQVKICEKLSSPVIEESLADLNPFYRAAAEMFTNYPVPQQQVDLMISSLDSSSVVMRVAAKCAIILLAAYIELDNSDG